MIVKVQILIENDAWICHLARNLSKLCLITQPYGAKSYAY